MHRAERQFQDVLYGVSAKAALRILDGFPGFEVNPEIGKFASEPAGARHDADDLIATTNQNRVRGPSAQKVRNILRKMLAVAVESQKAFRALIGGISKCGQERRPFSLIGGMSNYRDAQRFEKIAQVGIGAAVVDDEYVGNLLTAPPRHVNNRGGIVVNRYGTPDACHVGRNSL
jgi:hypothetical protein